MPIWDFIVIGEGQAGGEAVRAWPQYYDNLKLFSPAKYSSLPGLSIDSPGTDTTTCIEHRPPFYNQLVIVVG